MHRTKFYILCLFAISCSVSGPRCFAEVRLPGFFGDHMVVQQQKPIRVWGWADEGESVSVTLGKESKTTVAKDGQWQVELPAMQASREALTLTVAASNEIKVKDVLIGEVWLCSGQSNMEWTVKASKDAAKEIAAGNFPLIRHIKAGRRPSTVPLDDIQSDWQICSPDTVGSFTACGYYMARELHQELNVPIGLINSSWGGTRVEPWTPVNGFAKVEQLQEISKTISAKTPGSPVYQAALAKHIESTQAWLEQAKDALESKEVVGPNPVFPAVNAPFKSHQEPTMLYNGMIHALVGYPIRGAIWYQGESNHAEGMLYYHKKKALIEGWRELWDTGQFPFYYVQIAPFQYGSESPTILAEFWEAQAKVQEIPQTGMVVINDIATLNNIHPPNKQDVGRRLALLALKNQYGKTDLVANSPEMESMDVLDGSIRIKFRNVGGELRTRDNQPPTHFEVIGVGSKGYQPADAKIDGQAIVLTSQSVAKPVAFRFAWNKLAEPNLTGSTGLPVGAFRGGVEPDFESLHQFDKDYSLVYDLDLSKLGPEIEYSVDNSEQVKAFDRIAYLLQLRGDSGDQHVFVSMKAFTQDATKIGVPAASANAEFQQTVDDMEVIASDTRMTQGRGIKTGNIEFWPHNYGPQNGGKVRGASPGKYDFGDAKSAPVNGYGCMQVHNFAARQTIFAINHWSVGGGADIGIGNCPGEHSDWTFSASAKQYKKKRLRVYVRETN